MNVAALAWSYLRARPLATLLNIVLLALGVGTIGFVWIVDEQIGARLQRDARGIDLVVGAKGSPLQLILTGIYHLDVPTGNIPLQAKAELESNPLIKRAIPLSVSAPFHCSLMQPAADRMAAALAEVTIRPLAAPVLANVTAAEKGTATGTTTAATTLTAIAATALHGRAIRVGAGSGRIGGSRREYAGGRSGRRRGKGRCAHLARLRRGSCTGGGIGGGEILLFRLLLRRVRHLHRHRAFISAEENLDILQRAYCGKVGIEYRHIQSKEEKVWLREQIRQQFVSPQPIAAGIKKQLLWKLISAEQFERFLHTKYLGQKRFSLEGSETIIPLLDQLIEGAAARGVEDITLGMAHRGRLNVLANILGKNPRNIFREFEDADPELYIGRGDVKYHLGHSSDYITASGKRLASSGLRPSK